MDREYIEKLLTDAMNLLVARDGILLELDVNERSISHHLANYIQELVPTELHLDVDVEYNRNHDDIKRLNLSPVRINSDDTEATTVFPDIILHRRNADVNILVVEVKKHQRRIDIDEIKLKAFRDQLGYEHAAHVIVGVNHSGQIFCDARFVDD